MQVNNPFPKDRQPTLRVVTQPNDANPKGDIFGGWLMSQIDIAGAIHAVGVAKGPVATVAVKGLQFLKPLYAHDLVSFYSDVLKIGNTSVTVAIDVFAQRRFNPDDTLIKIAYAEYVYVAVSEPGKKRLIKIRKDESA